MNIIIENSGYGLNNCGDIAMLQVAVRRIQHLLPAARLHVVTGNPERLKVLCPAVEPLLLTGRSLFFEPWNILGTSRRLLPSNAAPFMRLQESAVREQWPATAERWIARRLRRRRINATAMHEFVALMKSCDAVVATGGGYLTDAFPVHANIVLQTLGLAISMGKPVALFGQGVGPLNDSSLRQMAARVLPKAEYIGLREGASGKLLLNSIGVNSDRIVVTGDDAIETAVPARPNGEYTAIGINVRFAEYSGITESDGLLIRNAVRRFASRQGCAIVPVPIAWGHSDSDGISLSQLLDLDADEEKQLFALNSPIAVVQQVSRCRVMLTGSYHAAVFALSQGTPVIGIAKSSYYQNKFAGLRDQFGSGCEVVELNHTENLAARLFALITRMWNEAPHVRGQLHAAADRQVQQSKDLYASFCSLVHARSVA